MAEPAELHPTLRVGVSPGTLDPERWALVLAGLGLCAELAAAEGWELVPADPPDPGLPLTLLACGAPGRFQRALFTPQALAALLQPSEALGAELGQVLELFAQVKTQVQRAARPLVGRQADQSHADLRAALYAEAPRAMLNTWRWAHAAPSATARLGASVLLLGAQGLEAGGGRREAGGRTGQAQGLGPAEGLETLVALAERLHALPHGPALARALVALDQAFEAQVPGLARSGDLAALVALAERLHALQAQPSSALERGIEALDDALSARWGELGPRVRHDLSARLQALLPALNDRRAAGTLGTPRSLPPISLLSRTTWDDPVRIVEVRGPAGTERWAIAAEEGLEPALRAWAQGLLSEDADEDDGDAEEAP